MAKARAICEGRKGNTPQLRPNGGRMVNYIFTGGSNPPCGT
ncbi:hypothetical protein Q3C19_06035 [Bacteroides sp. ET489]|nr:hypothetical protein [Bacteroides sp. ET489]MDO3390032.1 hypothetical protein [Bacteroides sp. ET489]